MRTMQYFAYVLDHKLAIAASAFVLFIFYRIYTYLTHPLRSFPGPFFCRLTNLPYSTWFFSGRRDFYILSLHERYGPVIRIAPNELSFNTANSWKDIYGFRPDHRPFIKSEFYEGAASYDNKVSGVGTVRDPAKHAKMRKYLSYGFSAKALAEQEVLVVENVELLIRQMRERGVRDGEVMDSEHWLRMATLDIMGDLAFGKSFDALKNGGQHPSVRFMHEAIRQMKVIDTMRRFPYAGKLFALFFARTLYKLLQGNRMHEQFSLQTVRDRLANPDPRPDILTHLQHSYDPDLPFASDIQLAAYAAEFLHAGADTSSTTINTVLNFVLRSPSLYMRLTTEIRTAFLTYASINNQQASKLPLLRSVILEAMRIYPPTPLGLPRLVPEGGDSVDGFWIVGGVTVSTNAVAASLSPKNFPDPYTFKPERWDKEGKEKGMDILNASNPFSLGARGCLGQNLAWMEMNLIICMIFWSFDLELVNTEMDLHRDSKMDSLWEKPPLFVRITERQ
ncbi:cytochrome P450 [Dendryphion nanum]|uniref:Cytochrome P450 n=1 Tax=Dendryphion nanum TaxID=256645 RepID=A0A9P9DP30_9PLEO|nr:cytochrome P450 [Dendryphion nanum]